MEIAWTRTALKGLNKLQPARRRTIIETMERIAANPFAADTMILPLTGIPNAYRRRFGDFRVSYTIDRAADTLTVFEVSPRGGAYR